MAWPWRSSVVTETSGDTRHEKEPEVNCLYFARSDVSVLNNKRQKYRLAVFAGGKQRRGKTFRVTVPALPCQRPINMCFSLTVLFIFRMVHFGRISFNKPRRFIFDDHFLFS